MKKTTLFIFFVLLHTLIKAQRETDFTKDKTIFIEKSIEYDKWLKSSGLGKVLRVETVQVAKAELSLDLGFYTTNADSVTVLWNALKRDYEQQDRGLTLEEELFYKMVYFMEIKPTQGYVQLFNSYDVRKDLYVCFFRGIKYDNNQVTVESRGCKTEIKEFEVKATDLSNLMPVGKRIINQPLTETVILKKVKAYLSQRLLVQKQENREPQPMWLDSTGISGKIWLKVWNLSKEVLADRTNPWWCWVLNPSSDGTCLAREHLDVLVKCLPQTKGYKITIVLNAKFGNGTGKDLIWEGYKPMEPDYKKYLTDYAQSFFSDLENYLKTK